MLIFLVFQKLHLNSILTSKTACKKSEKDEQEVALSLAAAQEMRWMSKAATVEEASWRFFLTANNGSIYLFLPSTLWHVSLGISFWLPKFWKNMHFTSRTLRCKVKLWSILSVSANQWRSRTLTGTMSSTVTSCPVPTDLRLVPSSSGSSHRCRYRRLIKRTGLYLITHVSASLMSCPTDVLSVPDPTFTSGIIPKVHILATAGCSQAFGRLWWMH